MDEKGGSVRTLLTDYRNAFHLIYHNILYTKLQGIDLKPSVLNWIVDFYTSKISKSEAQFKLLFELETGS